MVMVKRYLMLFNVKIQNIKTIDWLININIIQLQLKVSRLSIDFDNIFNNLLNSRSNFLC